MNESNKLPSLFWTNLRWLAASLVLAFGVWVIAVLRTDPIQERQLPTEVAVTFLLDEDVVLISPSQTVRLTLRAPRSELDALRQNEVRVVADLRGQAVGTSQARLEVELPAGFRGRVVRLTPESVQVTLAQLQTQTLPVTPMVLEPPPSGYTVESFTCRPASVQAKGEASVLAQALVVARLSLRDERNPLSLRLTLSVVNRDTGRTLNGVSLEVTSADCQVQIVQREGISELSVVPRVSGFPPAGYIYQGFEFTPKTVTVTGDPATIRDLNGVVYTLPLDLTNATTNLERTVALDLPADVRLLPEAQTITVSLFIGTIPGSRQFDQMPLTVANLGGGLEAQVLPNVVTLLVLGPLPTLRSLTADDFRVEVDLAGQNVGTYQERVRATIVNPALSAGVELTIQPPEVSITLSPLATPTP